jgi:hypothetical protein
VVPGERAVSSPATSVRPVLAVARRVVDAATAHPARSLALIVLLQLALTARLFATVAHNGWLTYQGGDQIWLVTSGWLLAGGTLPTTVVSYGWPLLLAPLTLLTGGSSVVLLPATTLLQTLVLGPLATLAVYDIASRIAGRAAGLWCALAVVVAPTLATPLFVDRYQERWTDQVLVQATGLTQLADYPSTVAALVCGALVIRSLQTGRQPDVLLAGTGAAILVALKPANAIFVAGPLLAYAVARRWQALPLYVVALLPTLALLTAWKWRGLGTLPVVESSGAMRLAAGAGSDLVPVGVQITKSAPFHLDEWLRNMSNLREFFFSARLAQWAPIAGVFAVGRLSRPAAALLGAWVGAYFLVKGSSFVAGIENASFWRLVMPALPAYVMLVAALPLLVPTLQTRIAPALRPLDPPRGVSWRVAIAVAAVVALVPAAVILAATPQDGPDEAVVINEILVPVDGDALDLTATRTQAGVVLRWRDTTTRATPFFVVFRAVGRDVECERIGADRCELRMDVLGVTRATRFVDREPVAGAVYRVGVAANWLDDPQQGDVFLVSEPVRP